MKFNFSVESDRSINPFVDFYEISEENAKDSSVRKVDGNGLWHIVKSHDVLPRSGKYSFAVKVIMSETNCIEVGIMSQEFIPLENKICERSIGFHYANGKVHDTNGSKEKRGTKWRVICEPIPKGKLGTIEVNVDVDGQMVYWMLDGKLLDKSVLTNYLTGLPCVGYVSMVNIDDTVMIERHQSVISARIAEKPVDRVRESAL